MRKKNSGYLILFIGLGLGAILSFAIIYLFFQKVSTIAVALISIFVTLFILTVGIIEIRKTQRRGFETKEDLEYRYDIILSELRRYQEETVDQSREMQESHQTFVSTTLMNSNKVLDNWQKSQIEISEKLRMEHNRIEEVRTVTSNLMGSFATVNLIDKDAPLENIEEAIYHLNQNYSRFISLFVETELDINVEGILEELDDFGIYKVNAQIKGILMNSESNEKKSNYIIFYTQEIKQIFDEMTYKINKFKAGADGLKKELGGVSSNMTEREIKRITERINSLYVLKRRRNNFVNENISFIPDFIGLYLTIEWKKLMEEESLNH